MVEEFGPDAPALYGAWCALLSVAAGCPERGTLVSQRGTPYTPDRVAGMLQYPTELLSRLFTWASRQDIGWLEVTSASGDSPDDPPTIPRQTPDDPPTTGQDPTRQDPTEEPNGSLSAGADEPPQKPSNAQRFLAAWNGADGVSGCRKLTPARKRSLNARCRERVTVSDSEDLPWIDALEAAMRDRFPLPCTRGSPDAWVPDADWILRPDSLQKVFEGKYDWTKKDGRDSIRIGAGQRHDPNTTVAW
ncbi:MAG: hypothetical protein AAGI08_17205 [Bacteroidota bacterium]